MTAGKAAAVRGAPSPLVLPAVMLGSMLAPLNSTMIAVALPRMQVALAVGSSATALLVTLYLITMVAGLPVGGRLGDRHGRRRVFFSGLALFAVASVGAALAPGLLWLTGFRVLQALAGALLLPTGAALVRELYPPDRRGAAFGMIGLSVATAAASGPAVSGVLVHAFGWASIFWMNVPVIALAAGLGWRALPPDQPRAAPAGGRFDWPGLALLVSAFTSLVVAAGVRERGSVSGAVLVVAGGVLLGTLFVWREGRASAPIIDPWLFRRPFFAAASLSIGLGNMVLYATLLGVPLYLERVLGESVRTAGLVTGTMSLCAALMTAVGGRWADRAGRRPPAMTGAALLSVGVATLSAATWSGAMGGVLMALVLLGTGLGLAGAPVQAASVAAVPERLAGAASGVYATARYAGNVVGSILIAFTFAQPPEAGDAARFAWLYGALAVAGLAAVGAHAGVDRRAA